MYRKGKYTRRLTPVQRARRTTKKAWRGFKRMSWKRKTLVIGVPIFVVVILIPFLTYLYFARDISDMERLMNRNNTGVALYAKDGKTLVYSMGTAGHRDLVPLSKISKPMQRALIASEDKDFYKHGSFSFPSTVRAVYTYVITGGKSYGGSTLTQQLAKITLLSNELIFLREYQAFSVAVSIEQTYSKDQILDMYLNAAYFGGNSFGIKDAAKDYFGTTPDKLTVAQSAMLVGLLPAPNIYSPVAGNATYAKQRQEHVLGRMVIAGYITEAEKDAAQKVKLHYAKQSTNSTNNFAPHFADMVLQKLYEKYGEEKVLRSGYRVTTTLDAKMQKAAKLAVAAGMPHIQAYGGSNAGLVAIDPKSGEIRAMVGSYNYNDKKFGQVNMATTAREPASSFEPIYYSDALANGRITPVTVLSDTPHDFGGYKPLDADRKFRGNVTVRQALNWSLNIPSVEVMQKEGIDNAVDAAKRLGITTLKDPNEYGLSLAIGSAEVPLTEMTNAYAAFANGGQQYDMTSIKSIDNKYGQIIFTADKNSHRAISEQGAYLISNVLSDNNTRRAIFGDSLTVFGTDGQVKNVAVKTGTTDNSKDAWTIGYTPNIVVGVWVGNNDNKPMLSGGSDMAGPIWRQLMQYAVGTSNPNFTQPSGITKATVCTSMGVKTDYFLDGFVPKECSQPTKDNKDTKKDTQKPTTTTKCTVAGKENLNANDPNCVEEMCTIPGKTDLAANDPNCVDDNTTDSDGDGVVNANDLCPNTAAGATVDANGCSADQTGSGSG